MSKRVRWLFVVVGMAVVIGLAAWSGNQATTGAEPAAQPKEIANSIGMKMVLIPAGKFVMGSPKDEEGHLDEHQHEVEITKPFYLGVYTVTQAEYEKVMGKNPSHFSATGEGKDKVAGMDTSRFPVEMVSWDDAAAFCKKLSDLPEEKKAVRVYRLPTEAEWEYACRARTTTPFHYGKALSSKQANFIGNIPYGDADKGPHLERPTTVGFYQPNTFGLYDMHGNVWQWCQDWYDGNYYRNSPRQDPPGPEKASRRVARGGGWDNRGWSCRSAHRSGGAPSDRYTPLGFRVAAVQSGR